MQFFYFETIEKSGKKKTDCNKASNVFKMSSGIGSTKRTPDEANDIRILITRSDCKEFDGRDWDHHASRDPRIRDRKCTLSSCSMLKYFPLKINEHQGPCKRRRLVTRAKFLHRLTLLHPFLSGTMWKICAVVLGHSQNHLVRTDVESQRKSHPSKSLSFALFL